MKTLTLARAIAAASLLAAAPFAVSADQAAPAEAAARGEGVAGAIVVARDLGRGAALGHVVITATIAAIDVPARTVTLRNAEGQQMVVLCGPEVRNFDQLAVGDNVTMEYLRAVSLELKPGEKPSLSRHEKSSIERARKGEKPGSLVTSTVTIAAQVVKVDQQAKLVTLRGPEGERIELEVKDAQQLANVRPGDQVEAVYSEAVAVAVTPAPAR